MGTAHLMMGEILFNQEKLDDATEEFKKAHDEFHDPANKDSHSWLSLIHI